MGLFDTFIKALGDASKSSSIEEKSHQIRCASCGSADLFREGMDTLVCRKCGTSYSLDAARKSMGTSNCRDCIYHSVDLYNDGISERCGIWGYQCHSRCDRKETKPPRRWKDENRFD